MVKNAKDIDWRASIVIEVTKDCVVFGNRIAAGTACWPTNTILHNDVKINFPPPSPTALNLSLAFKNFKAANKLYANVVKGEFNDNYDELYDFLEHAIATVLFSFGALESFANEKILQDNYYEKKFKNNVYGALSSKNVEWLSLDEKLGQVLPQQLKIQSIKGTSLWEKYIVLRRIRNKIAHTKTKDQERSNVSTGLYPENIWHDLLKKHEMKFPELAHKIILHFEKPTQHPHWLRFCNHKI